VDYQTSSLRYLDGLERDDEESLRGDYRTLYRLRPVDLGLGLLSCVSLEEELEEL